MVAYYRDMFRTYLIQADSLKMKPKTNVYSLAKIGLQNEYLEETISPTIKTGL